MPKTNKSVTPEAEATVSPQSKPRGRPRAFDREVALEAAMRLFWQKGFAATSVSDLTELMGIGSPSLYATFGSKEALYAESFQYYRDKHEALVFSRMFDASTARDAIAAYLKGTAAGLTSGLLSDPHGCMVTLSSVGSEGHAELGDRVRLARLATLEKLKSRLLRAVEAGEISPDVDIHALARFIQTVQSGMSILARDGADREELETVAESSMHSFDKLAGQ